MMWYYAVGLALIVIIAYLLLTGGFDIGENLQFLIVGFLTGIILTYIYIYLGK